MFGKKKGVKNIYRTGPCVTDGNDAVITMTRSSLPSKCVNG